jgi:hypothetical protein
LEDEEQTALLQLAAMRLADLAVAVMVGSTRVVKQQMAVAVAAHPTLELGLGLKHA